MKTVFIRGVDDLTHRKMRLLAIGLGITMPELLKQMVELKYNSTDVPDKDHFRKMKRFVKKLKLGGNHGEEQGD